MRLRRGALIVAAGMLVLPACAFLPPRHHPGPPAERLNSCPPIAAGGTSGGSSVAATAASSAPTDTVHVDLGRPLGPVNRDLTGVVWNTGSTLTPVAPVHPTIVRIDGSLQDASPAPGQLDVQPLLQRVAQVRAIGAEPLVILSYMPRWLGAPRAGTTHDPTRMGPSDLDAWQALVTLVVRTLATAPEPAYRFEVWNEPDISIFWQDTAAEFVAMALRTHRAVVDVEHETGLALQVGGPADATGGSGLMVQYVQGVVGAGLPLDFVSWHKYANTPFLGPDGAEGNLPPDVYALLAKRNPDTTPLQYSAEIASVRARVDAALQGTGVSPPLVIDEWNVSAGGYDVRHDDAEGAALDAGILIEMERAGLDAAAFYRAISGSADHVGDWGLVYSNGTPKPAWWVFRAWSVMTGARLGTTDDAASGLWARATRDRDCVDVLLSNFVATGAPARTVDVDLDGRLPRCFGPRGGTLAALDTSSTTLAGARPVRIGAHATVTVPMASQSVALLRVGCARP